MRSAPLLLLALLVACDDSDDRPSTTRVAPDVVITVDNAVDVARAVTRAAFDPANVGYLCVDFLRIPPPAPPTPPPAVLPALVVQTIFGPSGGEATYTWDDRDDSGGYTTGDTFTIGFLDYAAEGLVLNGTAVIDQVFMDGDPVDNETWIVNGRLSLFGVGVGIGTATYTLNVDLPFRYESRQIVRLLTLTLPSDFVYGPYELQQGSLVGRNEYPLLFRKAQVASGQLRDATLGGVVDFRIEGVMSGFTFFADPDQGTLDVAGAANTRIELQPAGDFVNVDIRVFGPDADGDEALLDTLQVPWSTLLPMP